jgi:PAS domain S-box-containing protein
MELQPLRIFHIDGPGPGECRLCAALAATGTVQPRHLPHAQHVPPLALAEHDVRLVLVEFDRVAEGERLCRIVQRHAGTRNVPILAACRSRVSEAEQARLLDAGALTCLVGTPSVELLVASARSLTRLARVEQRRQTDEERFQVFVRSVRDYAIVFLDPSGKVAGWNAGAENLFGYEESEILGKPVDLLFPEEEIRKGRPQWELETARSGKPALDQNWLEGKAGKRFWADGQVVQLREGSFAKIVQDKTAQKQAEQEREALLGQLAEKQAFLENVLELMPAGVRIVDAEGEILLCNEAARRFIEQLRGPAYPHDELIAYGALHPDGTPFEADDYPIVRALRSGEEVLGQEVTARTNQGEWMTLAVYAAPVRDDTDRIVAGVSLIFDISRQKQTELELQEALRLRDEFLSIATHELSTPLSALLLRLQLLQRRLEKPTLETPSASDMLSAVSGAVDQVQRLTRMFSQLLDVSRIRAHQMELEVDTFDLCDLVRDVCARFSAEAERQTVELRLRCSGPVFGSWDRIRLDQVLTNLISNALKYGRRQPIDVVVESTESEANLVVVDRGIGIAEQDQKRIFQRFERATERATRQSLGLGLFVAKEIVEAHAGHIELESTEGQGSKFIVKLPRRSPAPSS